MKQIFLWLFLNFSLITACTHQQTVQAPARPPLWDEEFVLSCARKPDCELEIFKRFSRAYRPSKEEKEAREAIQNLFTIAHAKLWQNSQAVSSEGDAAGNLLIRLPATGNFAKGLFPTVALQGHMDMVLAVKDAKPEDDRKPHFKNGVSVAETDGWLHAADGKTTLGADDGIAMAIALRYLLDPALPHPPLELLFTTDEEAGMTGIRNLTIPLRAEEFINIDSPDNANGNVNLGSMGGKRNSVSAEVSLTGLPADMQAFSVRLSGLRGGHSGVDIHFQRVNAIKAYAELFSRFMKKHPKTWLLSAKAGGVLNQIPTGFSTVIAIPKGAAAEALQKELGTHWKQILKKQRDEDQTASLTVEEAPLTAHGLPPERFAKFLSALERIPHGILVKKNMFPHQIQTSSNLATFALTPQDATAKVEMNTYTRSFFAKDLWKYFDDINRYLASSFVAGETPAYVDPKWILPPWMSDPQSKLLKKAFKYSGHYRTTSLCPCGLELGFVAEKYPNMQIISIGANIENPHTVNERMEVESVRRLSRALARILAAEEPSTKN